MRVYLCECNYINFGRIDRAKLSFVTLFGANQAVFIKKIFSVVQGS